MPYSFRILIVEDQATIATMITRLLSRRGCEVVCAMNADAAIQQAVSGNFDLITMDIELPDASGLDLLERFKSNAKWRSTPIVMVSGAGYEEYRQRSLELGAVDFIPKPFDGDDFLARIFGVLKRQCIVPEALSRAS